MGYFGSFHSCIHSFLFLTFTSSYDTCTHPSLEPLLTGLQLYINTLNAECNVI